MTHKMYTKAVAITPANDTPITLTDGVYVGATSEGGTLCDLSVLNPNGEVTQNQEHEVGSSTTDVGTYIEYASNNSAYQSATYGTSDADHIKIGVSKENKVTVYQPDEGTSIDNMLHNSSDIAPTHKVFQIGHAAGTMVRAVMVWDLSDIPADATITAASMVLTEHTDEVTSTMTVRTYRITQAGVVEDCDWTNYEGSNAWSTAGGDYSTSITSTTTTDGGDLTVNDAGFVSLAQDAVDNQSGNLRIIMISQEDLDGTTSGTQRMRYNTSSYSTAADRPKLTVTYDCPRKSRGLIRFNLTDIPHDATVSSATIQLNKASSSWDATPDGTLDRVTMYRQNPAATAWDKDQMSWINYDRTTALSTAGGDWLATAVAYASGTDGTFTATGSSIVSYVQAAIDDTSGNKGILDMIMMSYRDVSSSSLNVNAVTTFHSGSHASLQPTMKITYTSDSLVYTDVKIGIAHPIRCKGVNASGTTGSSIVGLYHE